MANEQKITDAIEILAAAFPNNKITQETIRVYQIALSDIPSDVLEKAIIHITTTNKFFPTVAEIRDAAYLLMAGINKIPSAFEAWKEVQDQIAICGDYWRYSINEKKPEYTHPLIEKAVSIMGYKQLCESDNVVADRAHFFRVYESLYQRAMNEMKMLPTVKQFSEEYQLTNGKIKVLAEKLAVNNKK